MQHFIHHLAPTGQAGFVLASGSMSSNQSGEGDIRKGIIEADLVGCMVALPGQLFYSAQIPVCLWFLARNKRNSRFRDRRAETLFIDARKLGSMVDRIHRESTDEDIARIAGTYHAWRGDGAGKYADVADFCKAATLDDMRKHGHVLTPGRMRQEPPAWACPARTSWPSPHRNRHQCNAKYGRCSSLGSWTSTPVRAKAEGRDPGLPRRLADAPLWSSPVVRLVDA